MIDTPSPDPTPTPVTVHVDDNQFTVKTTASFWVMLSPAPDGGTVSLAIDGVVVDTQPVSTGLTYVSWTPAKTGVFKAIATFSGTAAYAAATSAPATLTVVPPVPYGVTVATTSYEVPRNTPTQLTATVTPDPGPGTVEFRYEGDLVGTGTLLGGKATYSATFTTVGYHGVTATFTGNADWSPRRSDILAVYVLGDAIGLALSLPADPLPAGPVTATATLSADPGGGVVRWSWGPNDYNSTELPVGPQGVTTLDLGVLRAGYYHLYAHFLGYGTMGEASTDLAFTVKDASATTLTANRTSATAGELPVIVTATVASPIEDGRTVTFLDDVGGVLVTLATLPVDPSTGAASYSSNALRVGIHAIRAQYNGSAWTLPSTSSPIAVTVVKDTAVHATFTPSLATFYPYREGFRDTVSLGGVLDERATVTIRVYASSGSLKRTWSLGTKAAGRYSASWNGRTVGGTALSAGRYTVRASFKDARGNTRTITANATISWRQATWKSVTVIRYGDQLTYAADAVDGRLYYSPDYGRGRTLFSAYYNHNCSPDCAWITGTAAFTLSSSALAYRYTRIGFEGHTYQDYNAGTAFLLRPGTSAWESPSPLPDYLGMGWGVAVSSTFISPARQVKLVLWCSEEQGAAFDVHYLKLTYQYAIWK